MELNFPDKLFKYSAKQGKKRQKKGGGVMAWLWDLVNPPDSSREKQES